MTINGRTWTQPATVPGAPDTVITDLTHYYDEDDADLVDDAEIVDEDDADLVDDAEIVDERDRDTLAEQWMTMYNRVRLYKVMAIAALGLAWIEMALLVILAWPALGW